MSLDETIRQVEVLSLDEMTAYEEDEGKREDKRRRKSKDCYFGNVEMDKEEEKDLRTRERDEAIEIDVEKAEIGEREEKRREEYARNKDENE